MSDTGADVTGVDLAPEMIKVAREQFPHVEFEVANAEHLPFEAESFDAALLNCVIHHFARPAMACTDVHRVLKPGGRFVFAGPIEPVSFITFIEALSAHHTLDELAHGPLYLQATREDYEDLLKTAGFRDLDVTIRTFALHLESLNPLLEAGWQMCNLSVLPQLTQDRIRETTQQGAEPYRTANGYDFPDRLVVGVATKST
jgi:ubiquinone/menaquinone biosynthesis C-methylase UbiE